MAMVQSHASQILDISTWCLARIFHESPAATTDMAVLPGVLGCSFVALRTSSPCDVPFRYASDSIPRYRGMVARWHDHLCGLATGIHKTSGLLLRLSLRHS